MSAKIKNRLNVRLFALFLITVSMLVLFWGKGFTGAVNRGLSLWVVVVIPALLPYSFLSALFVNKNYPLSLSKRSGNLFAKIFRVGNCSTFAFFVNLVCGCPLGVKKIAELKNQGLVGDGESVRACVLSSTASPMYLFAVGAITLGSRRLGTRLFLANFSSVLVVSLLFRFYKTSEPLRSTNLPTSGYHDAFFESLSSCAYAMISIAVTLILYSVLVDFLLVAKILSPLSIALGNILKSESLGVATSIGLIESTWGIKLLGETNDPLAFPLAGAISCLGGLSSLTQLILYLKSAKIKTAPILFSKIAQAGFCFIFCFLFTLF